MITIFTDGSSRGNPGPGGWAAIIVKSQKSSASASVEKDVRGEAEVIERGGREPHTTNNRMELKAAVEGLRTAEEKADEPIVVYTDSSYVISGITKWIHGWKRNGWKTKAKEDVLNKDLWMELAEEITMRAVNWRYVSGHVGVLGNERCDHIATDFADGNDVKLFKGKLADYDLPQILDVSTDESKAETKKSSSAHARAQAFSYVSMIGGVIDVHHSWAECEKRVKGARGAKYRKATSKEDEQRIIAEFQA